MAEANSISLSNEEVLELQRILLDGDAEAALQFLREAIWHKVKASNHKLINPKQGTGSMG
ncbi:MAG: hypothetical protein M1401_14375 [Chloroflexi bacterium]|nr:hypothetical protein [Chloroflexota bacterium]MCL5110016.1 hypothetical protein [Chloroflexota bacterium]